MKTILRILGVLLFLGGLVVIGMYATSSLKADAKQRADADIIKLEQAEKEYNRTYSPEAKKNFDEKSAISKSSGELLNQRKNEETTGYVGGIIACLFGFVFFIVSFAWKRRSA